MSSSPNDTEGSFNKNISPEQSKDTGLALILILLLLGYFSGNIIYFKLAIPILIVTMTFPRLFYPIAIVWFAFSHFIGTIMSKILLAIVFYIMVVPIAIIRRMLKIDSLKLKQFKKSTYSVMIEKDHVYNRHDLEKPF